MRTVFKLLFGLCVLICHFEPNNAGGSLHKETKTKLSKIIKSDEQVNGEFSISDEVLGEGATGIVYKGKRIKDKVSVAIKVEDCRSDMCDLIGAGVEHNIYEKLGACEKNQTSFNKKLVGIAIIHFYGKYHGIYTVMVMTRIKNTIADEFARLGGFSRETVLMIGAQLVERLQYIHGRGVIVQDVKTDNMGHIGDVIYLFDLNLAKEKGSTKYGKRHVGTAQYMALSAHDGEIEEDADMISLGYSLCRLYGVGLPWVTPETDKIRKPKLYSVLRKIKEETVMGDWLESNNCTDAAVFTKYFNYLDALKPNQKIDYSYLKGLFVEALTGSTNGTIKYVFDWMKK